MKLKYSNKRAKTFHGCFSVFVSVFNLLLCCYRIAAQVVRVKLHLGDKQTERQRDMSFCHFVIQMEFDT